MLLKLIDYNTIAFLITRTSTMSGDYVKLGKYYTRARAHTDAASAANKCKSRGCVFLSAAGTKCGELN